MRLAFVFVASIALAASHHSARFFTARDGVRLEVLDWGGMGRSVVLLAGGGNTAHVFDEFAPKLTPACRVFAITRRGFGASCHSAAAANLERLRDDILDVLDNLKLTRPVLIGHSIAGAELSAVAAARPGGIAGLVYLEAAYPYAFRGPDGPAMDDFQRIGGPQAPSPGKSDLASYRALRRWDARVYGFRMPEEEFRQTWLPASDGRPDKRCDFPGSPSLMSLIAAGPASIPVPALVVFALPHAPEPWMRRAPDAAYLEKLNALTAKQAGAIERAVPAARVVRLPGSHYIFLSNERRVLREIRAFLTGLP